MDPSFPTFQEKIHIQFNLNCDPSKIEMEMKADIPTEKVKRKFKTRGNGCVKEMRNWMGFDPIGQLGLRSQCGRPYTLYLIFSRE